MNSLVKKLVAVPSRFAKRIWSWSNDCFLGIETSDSDHHKEQDPTKPWPFSLIHGKPKHQDSIIYGAAEYYSVRRLIRTLQPSGSDVIFDLGCGKGRVICEFARRQVKSVVGVELNETHCGIARRNAGRLRGRKSPLEIRCEDAATTDLSQCTILFMANPFGPDTIREVLNNLQASLQKNPRKLTVVYYTPNYREVFQGLNWLHPKWELKTLNGDAILGWENQP